jgi:alkylation response protein AidB-like acyl-CoA dehydrogenase
MSDGAPETDADDITDELSDWIRDNWDADMSLGEWWERLAFARYAVPHWPTEWFGRGWTSKQAQSVMATLRRLKVPGPPAGIGIMLAGPTILAHGSHEQKERFLPDIVTGASAWCQLFSEPGAGSDLASVRTRAVLKDEGRWVINGQKVWTSNGHLADHGMLLARTSDVDARHHDLTWFAFDMEQSGVDVRPLREMTGRSLFSEVFIDNAEARDEDIVGGLNAGWGVARTTLMNERVGLGGGGGAVGGVPGVRGGMLKTLAGDATVTKVSQSSGTSLVMKGRAFDLVRQLAANPESPPAAVVRDRVAELYIVEEVAQMTQRRLVAEGSGRPAYAGLGSISKLLSTRSTKLARDVGMSLLQAKGMLWANDRSLAGVAQEHFLFSPASTIYGGTDQIQMNILAERVLGLPRD